MTVRAMNGLEIADACMQLHYHPHSNISGLVNGSARILYDGWTNNDKTTPGGMVYVHSLIPEPRFMTKTFLREIFRYAFETVDYAIGVTPGFNARALSFNRRLGFRVRDVIRGGYTKDIDMYIQSMHHSDCRYFTRETRS